MNNYSTNTLTKEQIYANFRDNLRLMIDKSRVSYPNLAQAVGVDEFLIKNILTNLHTNPNSYVVYRIAHYFNYDMDSFLCNRPDQLERIQPPLSKFQAPLSAEEFLRHTTKNVSSLASQNNISHFSLAKKIGVTAPISYSEVGKLSIFELHAFSTHLNSNMHTIISAPPSLMPNNPPSSTALRSYAGSETSPLNPNSSIEMEMENFRNKLVNLVNHRGITVETLAKEINYGRGDLFRFMNGFNKPHIEMLFRVAEYFGTNIDTLMTASLEELKQTDYPLLPPGHSMPVLKKTTGRIYRIA